MYQFIHVESYSRSAPKTAEKPNKHGKVSGKAGRSVQYIVDEAIRDPGAIPHIDAPEPPVYLHGEPLEDLMGTCEDWAAGMTDVKGRKLRKDALCLLAGVVSAPQDITPEAWEKFKKDSVKWLKDKYGDSLKTVIEHTDESHPHLHFYVVPEAGKRFESVHEGRQASADAKARGELKGPQNQAYKAAMRNFQDDFYQKVGIEHGFTRIGPARRRLTREEWKREQQAAEANKTAIATAKMAVGLSKKESEAIISKAKTGAIEINKKALIEADLARRQGEQAGFQSGLDRLASLPWFKRVSKALGRSADKLERLEKQVEKLQEESKTKSGKSWKSLARKYSGMGKSLSERLEKAETALILERQKAAKAEDLERENSKLAKALASAEFEVSLAKQWEEIRAEKAPDKPDLRRSSKHDRDSDMEL